MARKTLSILLTLCMVLSLMPFGAFAAKNDAVTYELTDQLVEGVEYLIVSANDGEAVALTNNEGAQGTAPVTIVDGKIELDDANAVWTSAMSGTYLNLGNNGSWLYVSSSGFSFRTSMATNRGFTYSNNQLQVMNYYKLFYDASSNQFTSNSSTTEKVYLFAKEGSFAPPEPFASGTYVIVANGEALTAKRADGYGAGGSSSYKYYGLEAVPFVEGETTPTYEMVWNIQADDNNNLTISNDGKVLSATYESVTNGATGDLRVSEVADTWTLSNNHLLSANCGKYLYYASDASLFSVRSESSAVAVSLIAVDPVAPCTHDTLVPVAEQPASCTEDGTAAYWQCSSCGKLFADAAGETEIDSPAVIPALGHDWGEWVVTVPAGDTTPGVETRTCARCGETETREIEPLNIPTYEQVDRLVDGVEYLIVNTNEDGTAYVMTNPGVASGSASMDKVEVTIVDGKITTFVPEALWTAATNGDGFTLTNGGNYLEGKSGSVSVFAEQQYPDRFWTYSSESVLKFNNAYVLYYSTGSSAFKASSTSHQSDKIYLFAKEGDILPCQHVNLTAVEAIAPTCTEAGFEAYWKCDDCGKLFSDAAAQHEIEAPAAVDALGHDWGEWTVVTAAGPMTAGSEKRVCSRCGEEETREIPAVIPDGDYLIVIGDHAMTAVRSSEKLVNTGYSSSQVYTYYGLNAVEYAEGNAIAPSMVWTFADNGDDTYTITNNGSRLGGSYVVPEGGGADGDLNVGYESAVWTVSGKRLVCDVGGKQISYESAQNMFTVRTTGGDITLIPVNAADVCRHTGETEVRGAVAATCTAEGYSGDVYCLVCGDKIADGAVTPVIPHSWDEGVVTKEATTTEEGVKTYTCTVCGETKTEVIPMVQPPVQENPFKDVIKGKFYYDAVLWAVNQDPQITSGYADGTFRPDQTCTRAQVVTFLWRAKGCPEPTTTKNPFKDVSTSAYYYKAVLWAVENNITTGYADGTFRPDGECTRAHVVTFLWRMEGSPAPTSTTSSFKDVPAGQFYTNAALWAVENGITTGYSDGTFRPDSPCTRGHVVTFLYRDMA